MKLQEIDIIAEILAPVYGHPRYHDMYDDIQRHRNNGTDKAVLASYLFGSLEPHEATAVLERVLKYWEIPNQFEHTRGLAQKVKHNINLFYSHKDQASSTQLGGIISRQNDLQAFYNGILWDKYCRDVSNNVGTKRYLLCGIKEGENRRVYP
jgi:hypothetical protein